MTDKEINETSEVIEEVAEEEVVETTTDKKASKKSAKEEKKPGFFARIGASIKKFWKTMKSELKRVTWFSRKQTFQSTRLVLVCLVIAGVVLGLLDFGISKALEGLASLF